MHQSDGPRLTGSGHAVASKQGVGISSAELSPNTRAGHHSQIGLVREPREDAVAFDYMHFDLWIRPYLLEWPQWLVVQMLAAAPARYSVLALAASQAAIGGGSRRSDMGSHHLQRSHQYFSNALNHLSCEHNKVLSVAGVVSQLFARVLMAYYHHSMTSHAAFRLAVLDSLNYVRLHLDTILDSPYGNKVLCAWYRLYLSCRPSRFPNSPLEHESASTIYPNLSTMSLDDRIHLACHQNLSTNDLIYNILTKTIELRSRIVMNDCIAKMHDVPSDDPRICRVVGHILDRKFSKQTQRFGCEAEFKADSGFVAGKHLIALLAIQKEKLRVWESRICQENHNHTPSCHTGIQTQKEDKLSTHRNAMNALYCLLCKLIFAELQTKEAQYVSQNMQTEIQFTPVYDSSDCDDSSIKACSEAPALLRQIMNIISGLDLARAAIEDRYSFGLTEVLRQLCYSWQEENLYAEILDTVWPRIEQHGEGFQHCHLPAHLAKKWILLMSQEYTQGRRIMFGINAMHESTPRAEFLTDKQQDLDVLVCGYTADLMPFLELKRI